MDAFCGVGGYGIGFVTSNFHYHISLVVCVDICRTKLSMMAARNAAIYHIDPSRIVFIHRDAIEAFGHYANGELLNSKCTSDVKSDTDLTYGFTIGRRLNIDAVFLSPPWGEDGLFESWIF